jgi:hypothetical protein
VTRAPERDKREQVGPAISRLDILTGSPTLKEIVGQTESSIDFADILESRKIVLLRIPANLNRTVKNLLGTIVISELLYEILERADHPEKSVMPYFGIYCDEFQEFATPDFAKLFTQTGKFRAMPVVAHLASRNTSSISSVLGTRPSSSRRATAILAFRSFFFCSVLAI